MSIAAVPTSDATATPERPAGEAIHDIVRKTEREAAA